ncbi:hypothetical protein BC938DRAFT_482470 [Jimgerdemannia flammicorona]|uniref:CUE domain-containing protein n=1 Tax=Jimgerdemannia flammicorona TaxID=994334 RepID=A0A433QE48_9FUNG|nr:hypothetical protein BC938DRAFT_482470 [Jimgerdemannia flammicorona]
MALNHPGTVAAAALPPAPLLPMALDKGLDKQKVKQLKEVFPNCSDKALISALERADGNPDTAIDLLLLDSAEEEEAGGAGERPANENNDDGEWLADFTYPNVIMLDDDGWETFPTTVENKGEPWDVKTEAMVVNVERGRRDPQPISLDDDDGNTSSDEFIDLSGPDKGKAPALVHVDRRDKTTIVVDDSSSDDGLAIINALFNPGSSASPSSSSANHELQLVTLDAGSSSTAFSATPVTLPPAPESESEPVTLDLVLASVQAVFPDCDPEFVATLYAKHKERVAENQLVEMCVADVAETEGKYPKLETGKNKRKREEEPAGEGQASGDGEKSKRDYSKCEAREGLDEVYYAEW